MNTCTDRNIKAESYARPFRIGPMAVSQGDGAGQFREVCWKLPRGRSRKKDFLRNLETLCPASRGLDSEVQKGLLQS